MGSRARNSTRASPARSPSRHRTRSRGGRSSQPRHTSQHAVPVQIKDVIEQERRRLRYASAVLSCLKIAAMYQEWHEEIDAGDVALIVQDLIHQAIDRLDLIQHARSSKELKVRDARADAHNDDDRARRE